MATVKSGNREVIANIKVRKDGGLDWDNSYGIGRSNFLG